MNEGGDGLFLLGELVVEFYGFFGLEDVGFDAEFFEHGEGFGHGVEGEVYAAGEDDDLCAVVDEFLDVGGLDAGLVAGSGLVPVPGAHAAGVEFGVFEGLAVDFEAAPGEVGDWKRFHLKSFPWSFTFSETSTRGEVLVVGMWVLYNNR